MWLRIYKKHTGKPTIVWEQAVEAALCYGWIDSVVNKLDDESYIQRFTPRRPRSIWSKKNCETAERLIAAGTMTSVSKIDDSSKYLTVLRFRQSYHHILQR